MLLIFVAGLLSGLLMPQIQPGEQFRYVHGGDVKRVTSTGDDKVWTTHTGGVIRWSDDGGATFGNAQLPTSVTRTLQGIQIASDVLGPFAYCVGEDGVLLFSTDEGRTWTLKPTVLNPLGNPAELWDVHFEDRDHGWICGFEHTLYETFDGGATWTDIAPGGHIVSDNPEWYRIHALSDGEWIATADQGWYVRRLVDGSLQVGQILLPQDCYQPQNSSPPYDLELWGIDFVGDVGLAAGGVGANDGYVFRSVDRGESWGMLTSCMELLSPETDNGTPPSFYGVEMFGDPLGGVVAGYGSGVFMAGPSSAATAATDCATCPAGSLALIQVLNDSDAEPGPQQTDDQAKPAQRDLTASDSKRVGWTVGDFGTVRRSDDHGASWTDMAGLHRGRLGGGEFADSSTGVLYGQGWHAYWTSDGGQHLTLEYNPAIPLDPSGKPWFGYFRDAAVTPGGAQAVVVGDRGRIAVRDSLGTWTDRSIGQWGQPTTLYAVLTSQDAQAILTSGLGGRLFVSLDNGVQFDQVALRFEGVPVTADLTDMVLTYNFILYLGADQRVYAAPVGDPLRAVVAVPLVGSTATPTVLGAGDWGDVYVGNAAGEVFRFDPAVLNFRKLNALSPADLGGTVSEIEPVPGSKEWFIGGDAGMVQHYDGRTWTAVKSNIEKRVLSMEFFSPTEGLVVGPVSNVGAW